MLRGFDGSDKDILKRIVCDNKFKNAYLYIDINTYGFINDEIATWIMEENNEICAVLYKYYNSLQLLTLKNLRQNQILEICEHITENGYEMISGECYVLSDIAKKFGDIYDYTTGCTMICDECCNRASGLSVVANENQCGEIAELICSDESIGGHYTVELLSEQLKERMNNYGCRNIIILKDNRIISHMATCAEASDIGVLGGLVTHHEYRGRGYGKMTLNDITLSLLKDNKIPLLYCYKPNLIKWYELQGWKQISKCGKLEKIKTKIVKE